MYQIKDTATGELYRTHHGDPMNWETRGEAMKFAEWNFPGDLGRGAICIILVQASSPDYLIKLACVHAIFSTMSNDDQLNLISELFELTTPGED